MKKQPNSNRRGYRTRLATAGVIAAALVVPANAAAKGPYQPSHQHTAATPAAQTTTGSGSSAAAGVVVLLTAATAGVTVGLRRLPQRRSAPGVLIDLLDPEREPLPGSPADGAG